MSGFAEQGIPYQPGTPEYEQFMRGQIRGLGLPAASYATGVTSLGSFPGKDVKPGPVEEWLPGIVTRAGGGIFSTADALTNFIDKLTGQAVRPTPQWLTRTEELGESTRKQAESTIEKTTGLTLPKPENSSEQLLSDLGDQAGLMSVPIPGKAVEMLPGAVAKGISPLVHMVAPLATESKVVPFVAASGIMTGQAAAEEAADKSKQQPPTSLQPPPTPDVKPTTPAVQPVAPTQQFGLQPPPAPTQTQPAQPTQQFGLQPPVTTAAAGGFGLQPPTDSNAGTTQQQAQPQTGISSITPAEWIAAGLGIAGGMHYGGRILRRYGVTGPAEVGMNTPYGEQKAAREAYNVSSNLSPQNVPPAPLSVTPTTANLARAQAYTQDDTALLRAHITNSDAANAEVAHQTGNVKNQSAQQARVDSFMETGWHPESQTQTISPQEVLLKHGNLTPAQKDVVNTALWSATEQDHRTNMFNDAKQAGEVYDPIASRRYFRNTNDAELTQNINAGLADPETAAVMQGVWQIGRNNVDILRRLGYPTAVVDQIEREQAHYIPSMKEDATPVHVFDARDTSTFSGPLTPPTPAIDAFMQHQNSILKKIENDVDNRRLVDADTRAQINNPDRAPMFTTKTDIVGNRVTAEGEPSITIPRPGGWETNIVNNREIFEAMKGSPAYKRSILQASRNWFTYLTTGPGALLSGMKFFPGIHGQIRGPYLQMLNTPKDMYASYLDRLYQRAGSPLGSLGGVTRLSLDPYLGSPAMMVKTLYDRANHAGANMLLRGSGNPANMVLRHYLGDKAVDSLRQRMINNYQDSHTFRWRSEGGAGSGNYGRMEIPAYQLAGKQNRIVNNPAATLAPRAVTPVSWAGKVMPFSVNLNNLIREIYSASMEAPNMYAHWLNEDNPNLSKARLINESRALLGDPGKEGSGKPVQALIRNLPYTNATIQDVARTWRAKAEMGPQRSIHRSILLSMGALGSIYTAMHTPGGLGHLLNLVSTNQMASGPQLYNGNDTDSTQQISLPQSERATYPIVLDSWLHILNAWNAHKDEDTFSRMYHSIGSLFSQHLTNNALTSSAHGASQIVDPFLGLPGPVSAAVNAVTGMDPRIQLDQILDRLIRGRSPQLAVDTTSKSRVPNVAGQDSVLGSAEGNRWEHAVSAMFGLGGDLLQTIDRGYTAYKHGASAVDAMLDNIGQRFKDQNPMFNNILWNTDSRLSSDTPLVERTNKALDVMRDTAGTKTDITQEGYTRAKSGIPLSGMAERKFSNDPTIQNMRLVTSNAMDQITQKYMPRVNDLRKLDGDLNNVPMSEEARRLKHNEYVREINAAYIPIARRVELLNEQLSRMAGRRQDIASGKIDWTRGADQFK